MILFLYVLIGILYAFYNGAIKKLDTDGDWDVGLLWMFLWPLCIIALIISKFKKSKGK
jgi:hypothetical protein